MAISIFDGGLVTTLEDLGLDLGLALDSSWNENVAVAPLSPTPWIVASSALSSGH